MTQAAQVGRYRVADLAKSEALKIVTLRSTATTFGITVVAAMLGTLLEARADLHHVASWYAGFDPTQESLTGLIVAALTGGVFGALVITSEYSSGTIRSTFAAAPRRGTLLTAKVGVTAVVTVVFCEVLSFASFLVGQAVLSGGGAPYATLGTPHAFRAITMTGLCVALLVLISFGFGLVLRSTAGAIAAFAGLVFVLPFVAKGNPYTPISLLFNSISATVPGHGGILHPVAPVVGLTLMACYAAIALTVGALLFVRRDG